MVGQSQGELASVKNSLSSTAIPDCGESNWLVYLRMLGAITTACIGAATLLHQLQCEWSSEPTHWLAALGLVLGSSISCTALLMSRVANPVFPILVSSGCATALLLTLTLLELCETHTAFCVALLGINLSAAWLFISRGRFFMSRGKQDRRPMAAGENEQRVDGPLEAQVGPLTEPVNVVESEQPLDESKTSSETKAAKPIWVRHAGWMLFGIGFVIYMIVVPTIFMVMDWLTPVTSHTLTEMTLLESIRLHTVSGIVMLTFLGMGASIGSFLNVVIYRLPRSMPLLWPPSACANCGTRLRGKDNIPIVSWLKLGGRCRYCGVSISARYPIIETLVAALFVLFYYRELLSGGANLPVRPPNLYNGIVWILLYTKWDLVTIYLFHMVLLVLLLAWGMINYDRFRVPILTTIVCCATFVGLASALPYLNPTHRTWEGFLEPVPASVVTSLAGCLFGLVVGSIFSRISRLRDVTPASNIPENLDDGNGQQPQIETTDSEEQAEKLVESPSLYGSISKEPVSACDTAASLVLVGAALGPEAVLVVCGLSALFLVLARLCRRIFAFLPKTQRKLPWTVFVFAATVVLMVCWNSIHDQIAALLQEMS